MVRLKQLPRPIAKAPGISEEGTTRSMEQWECKGYAEGLASKVSKERWQVLWVFRDDSKFCRGGSEEGVFLVCARDAAYAKAWRPGSTGGYCRPRGQLLCTKEQCVVGSVWHWFLTILLPPPGTVWLTGVQLKQYAEAQWLSTVFTSLRTLSTQSMKNITPALSSPPLPHFLAPSWNFLSPTLPLQALKMVPGGGRKERYKNCDTFTIFTHFFHFKKSCKYEIYIFAKITVVLSCMPL